MPPSRSQAHRRRRAKARRQRQRLARQRRQERLQKDAQELLSPDLVQGRKVVIASSEENKMSEVLEAFAEPYLALADSDEATRRVIALAAAGWNASFHDREAQREMIDDLLNHIMPDAPRRDKSDFRKIMAELIRRKRAYFAEDNRYILNYKLTDLGDSFHLTVLSTLWREPKE
jgi:hypothetical protein